MKRELFGNEISQSNQTNFFSATDLVRAGNIWRINNKLSPFEMSAWLQTKQVKEFILELQKKYEIVIISGRGRGHHTWVHPFLFIDMALAISPQLKIEVYGWLYDHLIKYRNESGDSYKKMSGALWVNCQNKSLFKNYIIEVAEKIRLACEVSDWQTATEKQLELRNKIHDNIYLLSDVLRHNDNAVTIGIKKAIKNLTEGI